MIVRKIDELGRVVVPAEFRRHLRIMAGEEVAMSLHGSYIVFRRADALCIMCLKEKKDMKEITSGVFMCESCRALAA